MDCKSTSPLCAAETELTHTTYITVARHTFRLLAGIRYFQKGYKESHHAIFLLFVV